MGKLLKIGLPFVVLGGVAVAATGGNPMGMARKQIGKVKRMVVKMELGRYADRMITDYESTGEIPQVSYHEDFQNWVHTNFKSQGSRDPSYDYWDNPYEVVIVEEGHMILISRGPNGIPDSGCDDLEGGFEDMVMGDAEAAEQEISPDLVDSVDPDDDVCVEVRLIDR